MKKKNIDEVMISGKSLKEILASHKKWLNNEGGECANLSDADLNNVDLRNANLSNADLSFANLSNTNLRWADLSDADLNNADLRNANLSDANLRDANLRRANLSDANLEKISFDESTAFLLLQCPEEGSFIGFKKCKDNTIVKLLITEDALRSSATSRKCRCSKAKVLEITDNKGNKIDSVSSKRDGKFVYEVGKIVEVEDFDIDRWNECSTGIHFFITKREAELY